MSGETVRTEGRIDVVRRTDGRTEGRIDVVRRTDGLKGATNNGRMAEITDP